MKLFQLLLASIYLLATISIYPTTIESVDVDKLVNRAELIFEGEVLSWDQVMENDRIFTKVRFRVLDVVAGNYSEDEITLQFAGGTINGLKFSVGAIIPRPGEQGIYFVEDTTGSLLNPLYGWSQGHFLVRENRVYAADKEAVVNVQRTDASTDLVSDNVADGIFTAPRMPSQRTLTPDQFKAEIKGLRNE